MKGQLEQKYTATAQNPKILKASGLLEVNIGLEGEGSVKVEELPEEIEAAKTAAKACKKATRKIPALLQKLRVLKVQFGTRGRTECADKAESTAHAQDLRKINAMLEEFMEQSNALCAQTADLDQHFTENPEAAIASAVSLRKELDSLKETAEDHADCATKKAKLLQVSLNQVCLKDPSVEVKEEEAA